MSYKDKLSDLDRGGERSLTQQLVDLSGRDRARRARRRREAAADPRARRARGRQPPDRGARLQAPARARAGQPPGRARDVRPRRRRPPAGAPVADSIAWQRYALRPRDETYGDRVLPRCTPGDERGAGPALGRLPVASACSRSRRSARRSTATLRRGGRARAAVLRRPGAARARRPDRRALGGARRARGRRTTS